jgi:hypothetical protein
MPDQDNQPPQQNPAPASSVPEDDYSDVWLEDRKALPGETLYGGRGAVFPMAPRPTPPAGADEEAEEEFCFDICPVRLLPDVAPCMLVVMEQPTGFGRKKMCEKVWECIVEKTKVATLGRGTAADRLPEILAGGIDVRPTDAPIYAEMGGEKAAEYGCHEDQVIQFFDMDCVEYSYKIVPANTPPAELEALKKTYPYVDEAAGTADSLWLTRFVPDGNPSRAVYESEYGHFVPGDPRCALRCVLLLSDNFQRGMDLMKEAIEHAGLCPADGRTL